MPELNVHGQRLQVGQGSNLLDALQAAGLPVSWSCRAGQCQSCLVQAKDQSVPEQAQQGLSPQQQMDGWLLACQCPVTADMQVSLHDPLSDGLGASIETLTQLPGSIMLLRLRPHRPLRYRAGQHLTLWLTPELGRSYSLASLPGDPLLEFHIQLQPEGAFSSRLQRAQIGEQLYLGNPCGNLCYDPAWHDRPLLLLASGTGLAPLQAVARDALRQQHSATIVLWHWSADGQASYLQPELEKLAATAPQLQLRLHQQGQMHSDLRNLRPPSRTTQALLCGSARFVDQLRRPLFMAGLAGRQILDEAFLSRGL
ncbi:MAG: 2Fe-2S iron-sulfur cluster-binding protein [Halopseudomonas sp.]|uniref:2Fe-2S iron-sulfur cluster-binding protein n=1 Tax=Halopseudomonas sp. TaxID=2901191 RepID=UPI003003108F